MQCLLSWMLHNPFGIGCEVSKVGELKSAENVLDIPERDKQFLFWSILWMMQSRKYQESSKRGNTLTKLKTKLHGLSPRANYTDRSTADCRQSDCQLLRIEGAMWSA
jgi:hypothetical protein